MRDYKIGIDLSTTNTGIVVLDKDNNFIEKFDLHFRTFSEVNDKYNHSLIRTMVCGTLQPIVHNNPNCLVGIELSNFSNPLLTTRFSQYAGSFKNSLFLMGVENIKCFNSNQWQSMVGVKSGDTRERTKMLSRLFTKEHCSDYQEDWSEDVCDAYCIAYFLPKLLSTEQKKMEIKKAKYLKKCEMSERHKKDKMIMNRLEKLNKLSYPKDKRKMDKLRKEIENIKNSL